MTTRKQQLAEGTWAKAHSWLEQRLAPINVQSVTVRTTTGSVTVTTPAGQHVHIAVDSPAGAR